MKRTYKLILIILLIFITSFNLFANEEKIFPKEKKQIKEISVLFIPTKDSNIDTSSLLKRVIFSFTDSMPDVIVISGKSEIKENEKRAFYDYTIEEKETYILLKKRNLDITTKLLPITQNKDIDIAFLKNPLLYTQRQNSNDSAEFLKNLKNDNYDIETEESAILFLSLSERSPTDLSLWAEPSRSDVKPYWKIIENISTLGFYDAIENSRQNTSALGPLYTAWTYKIGEDEFRLDFLMLKNVAVADIYTSDLPLLSDENAKIKRRAIYAHLFVY